MTNNSRSYLFNEKNLFYLILLFFVSRFDYLLIHPTPSSPAVAKSNIIQQELPLPGLEITTKEKEGVSRRTVSPLFNGLQLNTQACDTDIF